MTDAPATNELLAERAELIAANEAATGWGAAVGARLERIIEIDRQLRAAATPSAQGAEVSVEELAKVLRRFDETSSSYEADARALLGKYRMEKR